MYIGKVAPPTVRVKNKVFYLQGEHRTKKSATTLAKNLQFGFGMEDTKVRKVKNIYAVYAR